jgi:hypothetical protein
LFWSDVVVAGKGKTNEEGAKLTFVLDELLPLDCFFDFLSDSFVDAAGTYIHSFRFEETALRSDSFSPLDGIYSYIPSRSFFSFGLLISTVSWDGGFSTMYLVLFFVLCPCPGRAGRK